MRSLGIVMGHEIFMRAPNDIIIANDSLEALADAINKTPVIDTDLVSKHAVIELIDTIAADARIVPITFEGYMNTLKKSVEKL